MNSKFTEPTVLISVLVLIRTLNLKVEAEKRIYIDDDVQKYSRCNSNYFIKVTNNVISSDSRSI